MFFFFKYQGNQGEGRREGKRAIVDQVQSKKNLRRPTWSKENTPYTTKGFKDKYEHELQKYTCKLKGRTI